MSEQATENGVGRREPAVPYRPVVDPAAWRAAEMRKSGAYLFHLTPAHLGEIDANIKAREGRDLPIMDMRREDFPLPTLGPVLAGLRAEILDGRGFAQIRGFPVERYSIAQSASAFWGIAMHLGDGVASQNAKGHVLGHIANIGQTVHNPNQRGPYSSDRIPYHVDCCDIVGLLCLHAAKSGGESTIASSIAVHNELLKRRPDLVKVLAQPFYRDRRGEIPPGMEPWYRIPVFNYHEGYLSTNLEPTYMGSAERHPGVPDMTDEQHEAVEAIQQIIDELRLDIVFQPGDMQFLNNYVTLHSRQAYEDHPEPGRRRHLLRIWVSNNGCRPLPPAYFARHGDPDEVEWPGGIVGPDTVLNAPLEPC
jgi:hypothetical protein